MSDIAGLLDALKPYGASALIFAIWYVYHKATAGQLNKIIDNNVLTQNKNFELLKDMIDTNILHNALLQRIESLILNNQWCPYARKFLKKGEFDEPDNNAD